jgi:hypothetical protein
MSEPVFESVVFFQDEAAEEVLEILEHDGEGAALDYLAEWHYGPGFHETREGLGAGTADDTYERDGYVLSYNRALGYIGLSYRIPEEEL